MFCGQLSKMDFSATLIFFVCMEFAVSIVKSQTFTGDKCIIALNNTSGICTPIRNCASVLQDLKKQIRPETCGFDGNSPIVCCPQSSPTSSGERKITTQKCTDYSKEVAGLVVHSIVGGTDAVLLEYPHMAALGFGNINSISWQCGGSLISHQFVLTAAHCIRSSQFGDVTWVRLGIVNLGGDSQTKQDFRVTRRIAHPQYRPPAVYNDIALLQLEKPVTFTFHIKPACLHTDPEVNTGNIRTLTATGWGLTNFGGETSNILQKVQLDEFTNAECDKSYRTSGKNRKLPNGIQTVSQICAGGRNADKDTCQGDSGGPLQVYLDIEGLHAIVGVTSFGKACGTANIPGVYSRVSRYIPWIESVVWQ